MEILNQILNVLNWIALNIPWELVIASGIMSPVALLVKQRLKKRLDRPTDKVSEKLMMTVVFGLSLIGSVAVYLLGTTSADPTVIATQSFLIWGMSQPFYLIVLKPFSAWLGAELAKARAFDAEVKSAAIPASGLPISNQQ